MLDEIRSLVEVGFAIHLLKKRSKAPLHSSWSTAPVNTIADLEDEYRKGMNIGVRLGKPSRVEGMYLHLIDLDIRDEGRTDEALNALEDLFPDVRIDRLPTVQSGSRGESRHFYFLTEEPFPSKKLTKSAETFVGKDGRKHRCWEIELFGTGKQAAIPPSIHPDTGKSYRWLVEPDLDIGIPVIDADVIAELVETHEDEVHLDPLGVTIEDAEQALSWLQDWADDRDTWVRVGMALKHEFGPDGWELFDAWSKKGRGYDRRNNKAQWRSFKNSRDSLFTMRSVMSEANDRSRTEAILNEFAEADDEIEREALKAAFDDLDEGDRREPNDIDETTGVPKHLLTIPGVLGKAVEYFNATAPKPQPQFAVQAALAIGSVVCARNWVSANENYTSLYFLNIGRSGAGKEYPKKFVEDMIMRAGLPDLLGQGDYTSMAAVIDLLHDRPRHLTTIDEMGEYLSAFKMARDPNRLEVRKEYLGLWGRLDGIAYGKAYAVGKMTQDQKNGSRKKIVRPALSLMGISTPTTFFSSLSMADVASGFLGRFLMVNSNMSRTKLQRRKRVDPPKDFLGWMRRMADPFDDDDYEDGVDYQAGISEDVRSPDNPPEAKFVDVSKEASKIFDQFEDRTLRRQNALEATGLHELLGRAVEMSMRVALIVTLSCEKATTGRREAQWAVDYVEHCSEQAVLACKTYLNANEHQIVCEALAATVMNAGRDGITMRELRKNHRTSFGRMSKRDAEEVLYFLENDHGITRQAIKRTSGRTVEALVHPKSMKETSRGTSKKDKR